MPDGDGTPTRAEIEQQLERMCSTDRFRSAYSRAEFLTVVVTRALDRQQITEDVIGPILFPKYVMDGDPRVRATAKNLRKSLREYYAEEGHHDLVVIALPEPSKNKRPAGGAYTPSFSYNSQHPAAAECALGDAHRTRGDLDGADPAILHYCEALKLNPNHVEAMLGMADVFCWYCTFAIDAKHKQEYLSYAEYWINQVLPLAPRFYRTRLTRGAMFVLKDDLTSAQGEFEAALTLDAENTRKESFYRQFLIKTGKATEALDLLKSYVLARPADGMGHVVYGQTLCIAGRYEEAEQVLQTALKMAPANIGAHLGMIKLDLACGRLDKAQERVRGMRLFLDTKTYSYLAGCVELPPTSG